MPSPLPPAGPAAAPTAPQLLPSTRYPDSKLMVQTSTFLKKDRFVLLFIVSGTWASPSVPTPHSKHGVSGGERLPCPGPSEVWPFTEDITSGHSLWDRQTRTVLTITQCWDERMAATFPSSLPGPSPSLSHGSGGPCPTDPAQLLALAGTLPPKVGPMTRPTSP